jgi:hypothetical protein
LDCDALGTSELEANEQELPLPALEEMPATTGAGED